MLNKLIILNIHIYYCDEWTLVVQTAGLSSPLHCDSGGAEWCVSVPCPWIQEGKNSFFSYSVSHVFLVFAALMIFSSSQVILSTNIAESSVTVPDVKYGGFSPLLGFIFYLD